MQICINYYYKNKTLANTTHIEQHVQQNSIYFQKVLQFTKYIVNSKTGKLMKPKWKTCRAFCHKQEAMKNVQ